MLWTNEANPMMKIINKNKNLSNKGLLNLINTSKKAIDARINTEKNNFSKSVFMNYNYRIKSKIIEISLKYLI